MTKRPFFSSILLQMRRRSSNFLFFCEDYFRNVASRLPTNIELRHVGYILYNIHLQLFLCFVNRDLALGKFFESFTQDFSPIRKCLSTMSNVTSHKMLTEERPKELLLPEGSEITPELYAKATHIMDELRTYRKVMVAFFRGESTAAS